MRARGKGLGAFRDGLFRAVKKRFGTTSDLTKAGWILPDGSVISLGEEGLPGRAYEHADVRLALSDKEKRELNRKYNSGVGASWEMIARGAVRVQWMDGSLYAETYKKPTRDQSRMLRRMLQQSSDALVDISNPEKGISEVWMEWGKPGGTRYHPDAVLRFMDERGYAGHGRLGLVPAPDLTDSIFMQACRELKVSIQDFDPHDAIFILPNGCVAKLDSHENIASQYPDELMTGFSREYEAVGDFIERGAIRAYWDGDNNQIMFQVHKKPTEAQMRIVREVSTWPESVYIDVQGEGREVVDWDHVPIFSKASAGKVVRFMNSRGFGQRVAYPAGSPRGRLKFHWSPGSFFDALEVAEGCAGPVRKVCKTEESPGGKVRTCTWRDSSGRIVAGAAGMEGEMRQFEQDGAVGRRTSLWTDKDLLAGRCPR